MFYKEFERRVITEAGFRDEKDKIAVEVSTPMYINKEPFLLITCTDDMLREFAVGHLVCEGIADPDDIIEVEVKDDRIGATINTTNKTPNEIAEIRSSGLFRMGLEDDVKVKSNVSFNAKTILRCVPLMQTEMHSLTGGVHSAAIISKDGEPLARAVDVGRHNAVDKVVGYCIINELNLSESFLLSSGRQPAGMVMKAARAGIPLVVSKAAPISSGVDAAERSGICLVCFASDERLNVYTHHDRIRV